MTETNKGRKIGYWVTTGVLVFGFFAGGVFDLLASPEAVAQIEAIGYPPSLLRLLGAFKVLGAIAIAAPKFPRLKEWAYAGMTFDLIGAVYAHAANGDGVDKLVPPIVLLAVLVASYLLRPTDRRLPDANA